MQSPLPSHHQSIPHQKPLLYSSIALHYPQTLKRFIIKDQKLHRIEKINISLFENPSLYNSLHCKNYLSSSQKRLSFLHFFPLDKAFQHFAPPPIFKNVQELRYMTLGPSYKKSLCVKPGPMKRLRQLTAFIDLRKSPKFTCSFYSRSALKLNLSIALSHEQDLIKAISPLFHKFPKIKSLCIQFTSTQKSKEPSDDFTQKFWKMINKFQRLEVLSVKTTLNSSYNGLIQLLPQQSFQIVLEINLLASLLDAWTPSQIENLAHRLNYLKKCVVTITIKWYGVSMTLMKKILSFIDKVNHKVTFYAQEEFTVSMNKTWIYDLLDELAVRPQKVIAWNAFVSADSITSEKIQAILSLKEILRDLKIECSNWVQNNGSEDFLGIFRAIGEFQNLRNLNIRLSIEPSYYEKDWKLDGMIAVVQAIMKGIGNYKGELKLIIRYKDDWEEGVQYEGINEEKMGRIWRLMEGLGRKVTNMMVIMNVGRGFKVEEMTKEMFEVLKGYKRMEYLEFESNFGLKDLGIVKRKFGEVCKEGKRLRGLNFRNETVLREEEKDPKVNYAEVCQGIKQEFIEKIENPYRWIDNQISIRTSFE